MIVDYHMHLRNEATEIDHTADAAEKFVARAAERGVDEIGFTEHVYYFEQTQSIWSLPYQTERCRLDLDAYVDAVTEAKQRGLPVKLGLEVDWAGEKAGELDEILAPYPWDYLLGSVHWLSGLHGVDSGAGRGRWTEWGRTRSGVATSKSFRYCGPQWSLRRALASGSGEDLRRAGGPTSATTSWHRRSTTLASRSRSRRQA